jgi:uncharacterized protein YjiS (DUF1127 family)
MEMIMSTISATSATAQGAAGQFAFGSLLGALKRWWTAYMTWRIEQAAIVALNAMSERELKDIGLTRSEIARAVRDETGAAFTRYW